MDRFGFFGQVGPPNLSLLCYSSGPSANNRAVTLSIAIIGATGYTGLELARLLLRHPKVEIAAVTSEKSAGEIFSRQFPAFAGKLDLRLEALNIAALAERAQLVFLCLPHHEAMEAAHAFREKGVKVIDLSADFRLHDAAEYESWYGPHAAKELLPKAVYGLPELHREAIRHADLIANPGCYPTSCILGLAPLLSEKWIALDSIHCDSKSGVSGAGRSAKTEFLFSEVNESFKAYGVGRHRHTPEIEQEFSELAGEKITVTFTPHLVPMDRGILSTLYAKAKVPLDSQKLHALYEKFYSQEPFVRLRPLGNFPATHEVRLSNFCDIGVHFDERSGRVVIVSVLDNLTKGASGQAIQNMNLRMGFEETLGLTDTAPLP
ncbi:MAG TPA: N-acetyl-gamma-glutamyl-phosphate reductase [Deltaproteobacteria bacterium]|nr:N-acetyl-gamma-glutamyl-phosphate reductase [Deltaproteobacteria bacterium]